jgi:hypothetical protein
LANGFLSTDREATDWEKRNTIKKDAYVQDFLKEAGLTLNKSEKKKVPPNDPCPCGSGTKYKRCCMNKIELTGVAPATAPTAATDGPVTATDATAAPAPSSAVVTPSTEAPVVYSLTATPGAGPQAGKKEAPKAAATPPSDAAPAKAAAKKKKKK